MKVKEVDSVVQYLDYICKHFIPNEKTHLHFYYRGVPYGYKSMIPNLYRDVQFVEHGSEYYYRRMFSRLGMNDYSSGAELLKNLAEFQHYGAKTSLLDVSLNPLISLYMAVEKSEKDNDALDQDGHIYLFKSRELGVVDGSALEEKFDTGHTAAIKCALSLIDHEKTNKFLEAITHLQTLPTFRESFTEEALREAFMLSEEESMKAIHEFMELLNQRARVKERLLYPFRVYEDMLSAQIVIPSICTERADAFLKIARSKDSDEGKIYEVHMTLRHLKVFVVVCECGTMRRASEKLHIAQPAISMTISELERYTEGNT